MSDTIANPAKCGCGQVLTNEARAIPVSARKPCPKCGSTGRQVAEVNSQAYAQGLSSMGAIHERPGLPKKKRRLTELFDGWQVRKAVGDSVKKFRLIDKPNDRFAEHVETASGEVLKHVDHSLKKDHQGHGSAKSGSKKSAPSESSH